MAAMSLTTEQHAQRALPRVRRLLHPGIWLSVGGPVAAYQILTNHGASATNALLVGALFPLATIAARALRTRRMDLIGVFSLASIVIGALATLLFQNPHILLVKDSLVTGGIGMAFLGSLFTSRPLLGMLAGQFAAGTSSTSLASAPSRLRRLTLVWGIALIGEAALRVALSFLIPPAALLTASPFLAAAVFTPLAVWTLHHRTAASQP